MDKHGSKMMQQKTLSLIPSFYRVWGWENSRNLLETKTFEDLRYSREFYQHPASLLRKETRLSTLFLYKVHV